VSAFRPFLKLSVTAQILVSDCADFCATGFDRLIQAGRETSSVYHAKETCNPDRPEELPAVLQSPLRSSDARCIEISEVLALLATYVTMGLISR
jgi:hypothetical protein